MVDMICIGCKIKVPMRSIMDAGNRGWTNITANVTHPIVGATIMVKVSCCPEKECKKRLAESMARLVKEGRLNE